MSTTAQTLPLEKARQMAEHIRGELLPYCSRIVIAGSIRRARPIVGDIDLVCELVDRHGFERRLYAAEPEIIASGQWNIELRLRNGVRLDIWIAKPTEDLLFERRPSNFGSLLLCRTGSVQHNIYLVERAKSLGLRWNPYWGVFLGDECIASEHEDEIFAALKLGFVPAEARER